MEYFWDYHVREAVPIWQSMSTAAGMAVFFLLILFIKKSVSFFLVLEIGLLLFAPKTAFQRQKTEMFLRLDTNCDAIST